MNQYFWKSEFISIHFNPFPFAGKILTKSIITLRALDKSLFWKRASKLKSTKRRFVRLLLFLLPAPWARWHLLSSEGGEGRTSWPKKVRVLLNSYTASRCASLSRFTSLMWDVPCRAGRCWPVVSSRILLKTCPPERARPYCIGIRTGISSHLFT